MKLPNAEMLAKPVVWFAAACAALSLALGAEWLPGTPQTETITLRAAPPRPAATAVGEPDADSAGDRDVDSWAETILTRPLFSVGRRPPKHQQGGGAVASAGMPRLSGIIVTRHSRRAIFMPDGGKPMVLAEGAMLDDATIRRITVDRVYLSGPKGDQVVYPSFDHNRVPPPPVIPAMQPFQPGGPVGAAGFRPIFPNAMPPPQPPPQDNAGDDDDNNNDDGAQPAPPRPAVPIPPVPGGFRNPIFPRGRPE